MTAHAGRQFHEPASPNLVFREMSLAKPREHIPVTIATQGN